MLVAENKVLLADFYQYVKTMPDKCVDLVVADPPYELDKFRGNSGGFSGKYIQGYDEALMKLNKITETNYDLPRFCEEIVRVMKHINIYIWCNKAQIVKYFNIFVNKYKCLYDIILWNKPDSLPTYSNKYLTDCEYCLYFREEGKGLCHPNKYDDAKTVYYAPINRENKKYSHPNIKPLPLILSHITNSSNPGDTILDPFAGSGTVGVACKELKRNYIGLEINEEYQQIANKRIEDWEIFENEFSILR